MTKITEAGLWIRDAATSLSTRRDKARIVSVEELFRFCSSRAALVSQKKLYGYLKERMGMSYPKMFADEIFGQSVDIAKMQVFAASLSDLTVFAVGNVSANGRLDRAARPRLASACYRSGIEDNRAQAPSEAAIEGWISSFDKRLEATVFDNVAAGGSAFTESPKALVAWAPIADEFKRYDRDIVENSIRYAWNEIIAEFRGRLDADAVANDWIRNDATGPTAS